MSRLARLLSPRLTWALTHPRSRDARRGLAEQRRRRAGDPHRVLYFHQVDDPYSHLAAQVLARLGERYDVELRPHLVGPPPDEAAPERERLGAFSRKDAADVAPHYGLDFPASVGSPELAECEGAARLLAAAIASGDFEARAASIGRALWRRDRAAFDASAASLAPASPEVTRRLTERGDALRRRLGHYLGAMFHYGGEWYWGVDRLWHLERRLQGLGLLRPAASADPIVARPEPQHDRPRAAGPRLQLEVFPSPRSPYTAIAMRRVLDLPRRLPVDLIVRPVLPMVMRGLPVPRQKRLYILLDTRREAEDAGEPFGFVSDPVGRPVERCLSLFPWARKQDRGGELIQAFTQAAFAEGIDTGRDAGLRRVVERAGLSWEEARSQLGDESWRAEVEANRRVLLESGLWGVPSFRLLGADDRPLFCTWGQDRVWLVEEEIARRTGRDHREGRP